jgi:hypothetical protein
MKMRLCFSLCEIAAYGRRKRAALAPDAPNINSTFGLNTENPLLPAVKTHWVKSP